MQGPWKFLRPFIYSVSKEPIKIPIFILLKFSFYFKAVLSFF